MAFIASGIAVQGHPHILSLSSGADEKLYLLLQAVELHDLDPARLQDVVPAREEVLDDDHYRGGQGHLQWQNKSDQQFYISCNSGIAQMNKLKGTTKV
ncbi:MAG: hypothetical protein M1816_001454 [Peltula sp. TS41687]|nr:MAG: hypothetical protein M1816_001454 [Peltula sp. TS41687]